MPASVGGGGPAAPAPATGGSLNAHWKDTVDSKSKTTGKVTDTNGSNSTSESFSTSQTSTDTASEYVSQNGSGSTSTTNSSGSVIATSSDSWTDITSSSAYSTETDTANGTTDAGVTTATFSNSGNQVLTYSASNSSNYSSSANGVTTTGNANTKDGTNTDTSSFTETGGYTTSAPGTTPMPSPDNPEGYAKFNQTITADDNTINDRTQEADQNTTTPNGNVSSSGTYTGHANASTHSNGTVTVDASKGTDDHSGGYSMSGSKVQHSDYSNTGQMVTPKAMSVSWSFEHTADRKGSVTDSGSYSTPAAPGTVTTSVSSGTSDNETVTRAYWNSWSGGWSTPQTSNTANNTSSDPGPQTSSDGGENPPVDGEGGWSTDDTLDAVQMALDVVGFIPVVGEAADLASGLISLARGDYTGALLSFGSMIPFAGWGTGAAKITRNVLKHGDEAIALASKAVNKADDLAGVVGKIGNKADDLYDASKNQLKIIETGCFFPGTIATTEFGEKPIETVEPGERVWSFDLTSGHWRLCTVLRRFETEYAGESIDISGAFGRIESTQHHPIWVVEGEDLDSRPRPEHIEQAWEPHPAITGRWVDARDLREGDVLYLRDGRRMAIEAITTRHAATKVYNFEVDGLHTYAVGTGGVLVHNGCPKGGSLPNKVGREFQDKAIKEGEKTTERIDSLSGKRAYRKPDGSTPDAIIEAKGGKQYVYFGSQLQDSLHKAIELGKQFILRVSKGTKLSGPLQKAAEAGWILVEDL